MLSLDAVSSCDISTGGKKTCVKTAPFKTKTHQLCIVISIYTTDSELGCLRFLQNCL